MKSGIGGKGSLDVRVWRLSDLMVQGKFGREFIVSA